MKKNKRVLGLSALVGLGLMVGGSANAYNMTIGGFDVQVDTTTSFGLSVLATDTNMKFVPTNNGGPKEVASYWNPNTNAACLGDGSLEVSYGSTCITNSLANFDGAINTDDGRLNFNSSGDLLSAPLKLTTDFLATQGNITAFARVNAFYDAVLMDDNSFKRAGISGGLSDRGENSAGYDLQLLDAYVSWDVDVADRPLMVRIGKQVINWGEATFIPGGNSAFNPIDVGAIRRPGAEIKEALLPVEAVYASLALTDDITVEAYYGGWDEYKLDTGGTAFASSDAFVQGTKGGNEDIYYVGGGAYGSGKRFAGCGSNAAAFDAQFGAATINKMVQNVFTSTGAVDLTTCMDVLESVTTNAEARRRVAGDTNYIKNGNDVEGDEAIGIALRWYAENLNSTEFAFYYQKMDSRLPYVSYRTGGNLNVTASAVTPGSTAVGRGHGTLGCALWGNLAGQGAALEASPSFMDAAGARLFNGGVAALGNPARRDVNYRDPHNVMAGLNTLITGLAAASPTVAALNNLRNPANAGTIAEFQEVRCILQLAQADAGGAGIGYNAASPNNTAGNLVTGMIYPDLTWDMSLHAEFPEVETYGMSFNTTIAGWGVQGDFTYRPDVPLQIDTDVLTIAALINTCAFAGVTGVEHNYASISTYQQEFNNLGCTDSSYLQGYVDTHDAITWDIGTTATFTQSNPIVSALGASLGVFLSEFQGIIVDGIEDDRGNPFLKGAVTGTALAPLVNTCTSGSDLPLNGALSIDDRSVGGGATAQPVGYCRPTDVSGGMVLMGQLQYNNVLGTPITVKPTVIISHGLEGNSPSPIGQWRQGVGSTALSFNFEYLSKWQASLAYRAYHGPEVRTKNTDRDHVSVSVSYAF